MLNLHYSIYMLCSAFSDSLVLSYKSLNALMHLEMLLQIFKKKIYLKAGKSLKLKSTSSSTEMHFAGKN